MNFNDPDNDAREVFPFPLDKDAEKWHKLRDSGRLFLGLDHTTAVVSDTESSLKFYHNAPGMYVVEY